MINGPSYSDGSAKTNIPPGDTSLGAQATVSSYASQTILEAIGSSSHLSLGDLDASTFSSNTHILANTMSSSSSSSYGLSIRSSVLMSTPNGRLLTNSPVVSPTVTINAGQTITLSHSNYPASLLNISVTSPARNSSTSNQSPGSSSGNLLTTTPNQGADTLATETLSTVCGTLAGGAPPEAPSADLDARISKVAC